MRKARRRPADRAVAYLRASTTKQELSLDAQRLQLADFAAKEGLIILEVYDEALGVSGTSGLDKRPRLLEAIDGLTKHNAGTLLISHRDRLARDPLVAATAAVQVRQHGARVVDIRTAGLGETSEGRLARGVADLASEFENDIRKAKTRAALAALRAAGRKSGSIAPYGYRFHGQTQVEDAGEQRTLKAIKRWRKRGSSVRRCRQLLIDKGHKPRGASWHLTTVARLCKRVSS
jgi:DNA invertase Pin-like site-specific DNA recombinase